MRKYHITNIIINNYKSLKDFEDMLSLLLEGELNFNNRKIKVKFKNKN